MDENPIRVVGQNRHLMNAVVETLSCAGYCVRATETDMPAHSTNNEPSAIIHGSPGLQNDSSTKDLVSDDLTELRNAYEREHRIADVLQRAILPCIDVIHSEIGIAAAYRPALKEAQVGGDFYDVFQFPDGNVGVVMGDVSGKGLTAAVYTAMVKYTLRAYAHENSDPGKVLERLNNAMCVYTPEDLFVTVFFGILAENCNDMVYANAGHDHPIVYDADSVTFTDLPVTGIAVGVVPDAEYRTRSITLTAGDVITLYTDGISDSRANGKMFGYSGICDAISCCSSHDETRIVNEVIESAIAFGGEFRDDAAVMAIKVRNMKG